MRTIEIFWTLVTIFGSLFWLYLMINDWRHHNKDAWPEFYNVTSKSWIEPPETLKLDNVLYQPKTYIETSNAEERLQDLVYTALLLNPLTIYEYSFKDPREQALADSPSTNETLCSEQLTWIMTYLNQMPDFRARQGYRAHELTRFIDSFGKPKPGTFLDGANHWIPTDEYCLSANLNDGLIKTRYCIGKFTFKSWTKREMVFDTMIYMGLCLPKTCGSMAISRKAPIIDKLAKVDLPEYYKQSMVLDSVYCLPEEDSKLRQLPLGSWIYISLILIWLTIVALSSFIREIRRVSAKNPDEASISLRGKVLENSYDIGDKNIKYNFWTEVFNLFTLRQSLKSFFRTREAEEHGKLDLRWLDCVKFLMVISVVFGHGFSGPIFHTKIMRRQLTTPIREYGWWLIALMRTNDGFFLIAGLITSFQLLERYDYKKLSNFFLWSRWNLAVNLRYGPLFMLVAYFSKLVLPYLGSGPFWDYGVSPHGRRHCIEGPWLQGLTLFGLYGDIPSRICNPPGWFLVCYTQLALIVPLVTLVISRLPNYKARFGLVFFLLVVSSANTVMRFLVQRVEVFDKVNEFGVVVVGMIDKFEATGYFDSLSRLGDVVTGCLSGYLLHRFKQETIRWPTFMTSRLGIMTITTLLAIVTCMPVISHLLYDTRTAMVPNLVSIILMGFFNFIWPVLCSILLITGSTIFTNHAIIRIMKANFWQILNKLGLVIFLIHYELTLVSVAFSTGGPTNGTLFEMLLVSTFVTAASLILALVIYLTFQGPLHRLIKLVFN